MSAASLGKQIGEALLSSTYLESDTRIPFVTFSIPSFIGSTLGLDENVKLGLVMASLKFWIALVMVRFVAVRVLVCCLLFVVCCLV
jgi:hypothetical protein